MPPLTFNLKNEPIDLQTKTKPKPLFVNSGVQTSTVPYLPSVEKTSTASFFPSALSESARKLTAGGFKGLFSKEPAPTWKEAGKKFVSDIVDPEKSPFYSTVSMYGKEQRYFNPLAILSGEPLKDVSKFKGLQNLSTKLLEKFKGMPDEITPQQFKEVINRATKEGIKKADLDLVNEMAGRQFNSKVKNYKITDNGSVEFLDDGMKRFSDKVDNLEYIQEPNAKNKKEVLSLFDSSKGREYQKAMLTSLREQYPENFNLDGTITLWRGGEIRPGINSYTISKSDAQGYSEYGFGSIQGKLEGKRGIMNEVRVRPEQIDAIINGEEFLVDLTKKFTPISNKLNLTKLTQDIQTQLVPLTPTQVKSPRYSSIGAEFIGNGKYGEIIYESPIKTSAGDVHYRSKGVPGGLGEYDISNQQSFQNYFSHIRFEDMADGKTRKILETQFDLRKVWEKELQETRSISAIKADIEGAKGTKINVGKYEEELTKRQELEKLLAYKSNDPSGEIRTFREEVKRAVKDGKDTLLIPSGETAMKIEGLGDSKRFYDVEDLVARMDEQRVPDDEIDFGDIFPLNKNEIKIGQEIATADTQYGGTGIGNSWIITDILGDGKFKAVPKEMLDKINNPTGGGLTFNDKPFSEQAKNKLLVQYTETFDISGKVDPKHFVYKLNEEAIPREARKMGLEVEKVRITNNERIVPAGTKTIESNRPGEWWRIKLPKERGKMPVEAFGSAPLKTIIGGAVGTGVVAAKPLFTSSGTTFEYQAEPEEQNSVAIEVEKEKYTGTNYDPYDPSQNRPNATSSNLGIGSAGIKMDETMVASSLKQDGITANLRLGTVIYIPELNKKFLVADTMNKRFNGMNKIDFAVPKSRGSIIPELNKQFTIQIIRKGQGRADARELVNSGQWDEIKNEPVSN